MIPIENNDIAMILKDLSVGYASKKVVSPILEEINLKLPYGQLICFMGPNGVGKSTLLRTISGIQKPLSGQIVIDGREVNQITPEAMAKSISLVLTDQINAGNLTAREVIALGRYPYVSWNINFSKKDLKAIEKAIKLTETTSFIDRKTYELSDGQLQKVMIARALAQDTPIIILDEPTAHLDLNNRVAVINLLKKLAENTGKAILMATHELDLALQTADRLWLAGFNAPIISGIPEDLVLNGAIDKVFQLKGYDLRTGQLEKRSLGKKVNLSGQGHEYLWTKNALERNGFEIDSAAEHTVSFSLENDEITWQIEGEGIAITNTLEELVIHLNKLLKY
ncbi:ABC transporter ATP-binding protein [Fulvivirga sediminis]|uniref:ABC transporter ATP-binding protein n=1 Tax=Fulvivirga sediminis TaxID=2803949 RepID=A0A937F4W8_9BACT|nr:ABC transporter ATP-binding protein [Fulvivirga sediminis]MBL3655066.1 ABC transporter ATP-binding protein [Fulvivirga sediminis]